MADGSEVLGAAGAGELPELASMSHEDWVQNLWSRLDKDAPGKVDALVAEEGLSGVTLDEALIERRRLRRLWSAFLTDYTVAIGPTWANLPWPIDSDLDPNKGVELLRESWAFITPGNALGLPSVALPMGVSDGLPTGIQVYSEVYREDLCLMASEIIESETQCPTPIDPVK